MYTRDGGERGGAISRARILRTAAGAFKRERFWPYAGGGGGGSVGVGGRRPPRLRAARERDRRAAGLSDRFLSTKPDSPALWFGAVRMATGRADAIVAFMTDGRRPPYRRCFYCQIIFHRYRRRPPAAPQTAPRAHYLSTRAIHLPAILYTVRAPTTPARIAPVTHHGSRTWAVLRNRK